MTEYERIEKRVGVGFGGGSEAIYGLGCLTCGVALFGSDHHLDPFKLEKARDIHTKWHEA